MAARNEMLGFADDLLDVSAYADFCPNGLQVPGAAEVTKVISGVSANRELIERAVAAGAELLIAHHGLFWDKGTRALSEAMAARLRIALGADLSIAGYHLPLDAHSEIGNNALLCAGLDLRASGRFAEAGGRPIGVVGTHDEGLGVEDLAAGVAELTGREPLVLGEGPGTIHRVGIVSGGGAPFLGEAVDLGCDALLSGEPSEQAMADSREAGVHFLAAGHHASERLGISALGDLLAERFGVSHEFVEIPNPV